MSIEVDFENHGTYNLDTEQSQWFESPAPTSTRTTGRN